MCVVQTKADPDNQMPKADKFFEERTDESEIKARIVSKYFKAWAQIIAPTARKYGERMAYIDLYAGPGRYKDGAASTPLLVLETAIELPLVSDMLVSLFNDKDEANTNTLESEISKLPGIEKLKHKPEVRCREVDKAAEEYFSGIKLVPTFSFIDPFGYKGLSLRIVNAFIKDWGCDSVFFFNYTRINMGLTNPVVEEPLDALFGENRAGEMRQMVKGLKPHEREALILEELSSALREMGAKYVLPFRFRNDAGSRTSHCLVFVSKHQLAYEVMKGIMAAESSLADQGVPSFTYCPADERTPLLFALTRPLDDLIDKLPSDFEGQTLTMEEIFERHHVDKPYIRRNYKEALVRLEAEGRLVARPPASGRRKKKGVPTFANDVLVTFPKKRG